MFKFQESDGLKGVTLSVLLKISFVIVNTEEDKWLQNELEISKPYQLLVKHSVEMTTLSDEVLIYNLVLIYSSPLCLQQSPT